MMSGHCTSKAMGHKYHVNTSGSHGLKASPINEILQDKILRLG